MLAGCTQGGGSDDAPASEPGPTLAPPAGVEVNETLELALPPVPLQGSRCVMHAHNVPVPAEQATPLLPPGFTAVPYQGAPTPTVNTVFLLGRCGETTGAANLTDVGEAMVYIGVVPPPELQRPDHGYRLVLAHVTDSPGLVAAYAAWNITIDEGEVTMAGAIAGPAGAPEDAVDGPYQFTSRSQVAAQGPSVAGGLRYFYARDGKLVGMVDRFLESTLTNLVGPVTYQATGAPLGNGPGGGYTARYDWSDRLAYTLTPVELPPQTI